MQFNSLGTKAKNVSKKAKADLPFNVAMRLEKVEVNPDKPGLFHGFDVRTGDPITVRLMTIDEGVIVNKRVSEDAEACKQRIHKQYAGTGEAHRPRPSEIANKDHKTHCQPGGLLMFTKCMKNEDGTIRAHWVDTLEKAPGAGCDKKMAHIRVEDIRDAQDRKKIIGTQVVADVVSLEDATMLNKDNAVQTLMAVFNNRNGEEKRKPFAFFRLVNPTNGAIVLPPARANALYLEIEKNDPDTGETLTLREAAAPAETLANLMSPQNVTQDGMIIRAALHGLGAGDDYPQYEGVTNQDVVKELNMITDAVRSGQLLIETVPGERISAGPATRASIEKSVKNNPRNPINSLYTVRDDNGFATERRFAETYITTKLGKDGHRLFTKAVPADCYPKGLSMMKLATVNDHRANADAAKARSAEANAAEVDVPDDMPFDPTALDADAANEMDEALQNSAAALTATM